MVRLPQKVTKDFGDYVEWGGGIHELGHGQLVTAALMALWGLPGTDQLKLIRQAGAYRDWRRNQTSVVPKQSRDELATELGALEEAAKEFAQPGAGTASPNSRHSGAP